MKILIAIDKFKSSLAAREVCDSLERGIHAADATIEVDKTPMADGGDGSLSLLENFFDLCQVDVDSTDPIGRPVDAHYLADTQKNVAFVELAIASGLALLDGNQRNPRLASTVGTGQLIVDAIDNGARTIFLFLGGSSTVDAGIGIAHALGFRFLNSNENEMAPVGQSLGQIASIDYSKVHAELKNVTFKIVCDVANPLHGPQGAAVVYGPQKGASPDDVHFLDNGLKHFGKVLASYQNEIADAPDISDVPGTGAAGGIAASLLVLTNATIVSGVEFFIDVTELEDKIKGADLIITGEGKIDAQSLAGKVPSGVLRIANLHKKPVIAVCGDATDNAVRDFGFSAVYTVRTKAKSLSDSIENANAHLFLIGQEIAESVL
ncbi:UNVERIFIED_CONTAM: hypothetical protein GTU68_048410 [Idotea baltica]|nr:hypothetical protein [Idotea baltica]